MRMPSAFLLLSGALLAAVPPSAAEWKPTPLARASEVAAALEACPPKLREGAGVYVLTVTGYELDRPSANGFHAIVERSQPEAFEPQCIDAVGSSSALERIRLRGSLQMGGASPEAIALEIGRAWEEGRLRAPKGPGINYMLSERNRVPVAPDRVIPYQPHLMFYAPYLTNADLGGDLGGDGSPLFVINEGQPGAYVIVPIEAAPHGASGGDGRAH